MSDALYAKGTTLSRATNVIAELTNIGGLEVTAKEIDVTNHQSPDGVQEYIYGLIDGGKVTIEGNFISSDTQGQMGLLNDMMSRAIQDFVVTFPDSVTTWTFKALITAFKAADAPVDGKLSFSATLKVTGKPVLAVAIGG